MESTDNKSIKNIEVGKFYFVHDGSKTGHPGYVVQKDDEANRYLIIRFDSDKYGDVPKFQRGVRHITMLSHPTCDGVMNSYVHNRPMLCKRKDIGNEIIGLTIHSDDTSLIEIISNNNPEMSPSTRRKKKK